MKISLFFCVAFRFTYLFEVDLIIYSFVALQTKSKSLQIQKQQKEK